MLLYEENDNFLCLPCSYENAKYVIIKAPLELTTSFLKGTKFFPNRVIEASKSLDIFDYEVKKSFEKIATIPLELSLDLSKAITELKESISEVMKDGKIPVVIGGEHTVTLSSPTNYPLIVFDAHLDSRKELYRSNLNHATWLLNYYKNNKKVLVIGDREFSKEEYQFAEEKNLHLPITTFKENFEEGKKELINRIKKFKSKKIAISIDLDVLNLPGVSNPVPFGFSYEELLSLIKEILTNFKLAYLDIVEGINVYEAIIASKLIYKSIIYNEFV